MRNEICIIFAFLEAKKCTFFELLFPGELLQPVRGRDQQRRGGGGGEGGGRSEEAGGVERSVHKAGVTESQIMGNTEYIFFPRDETGLVYLPTQLERTLQLYW